MPSGLVALLVSHLKSALDFVTKQLCRWQPRCVAFQLHVGIEQARSDVFNICSGRPRALNPMLALDVLRAAAIDAVTLLICKRARPPFTTADVDTMIERAARRGPRPGMKAHQHMLHYACPRQQGTRNVGDSGMVRGIDQSRARRSACIGAASVQGSLEGVRAATIF